MQVNNKDFEDYYRMTRMVKQEQKPVIRNYGERTLVARSI